jgi:hypothetical protein
MATRCRTDITGSVRHPSEIVVDFEFPILLSRDAVGGAR